MTSLVLLDHEAGAIKQPSRSAVAAAAQLGEVHVLVAGHGVDAAAAAAAKLPGVAKVHKADSPLYEHALAEPLAALLVSMAPHHSHLVAASSTVGKNVMPRVAALLDVQPISDISGIIDADTFVRPIYAGNALATVRSSDARKVLTVRAASFDPVAAEGGSAPIEDMAAEDATGPVLSRFVSAELSRSERPELTAARVVISGGRGMQTGENFHLLDPIADQLGAAAPEDLGVVEGAVGTAHQLGGAVAAAVLGHATGQGDVRVGGAHPADQGKSGGALHAGQQQRELVAAVPGQARAVGQHSLPHLGDPARVGAHRLDPDQVLEVLAQGKHQLTDARAHGVGRGVGRGLPHVSTLGRGPRSQCVRSTTA